MSSSGTEIKTFFWWYKQHTISTWHEMSLYILTARISSVTYKTPEVDQVVVRVIKNSY